MGLETAMWPWYLIGPAAFYVLVNLIYAVRFGKWKEKRWKR